MTRAFVVLGVVVASLVSCEPGDPSIGVAPIASVTLRGSQGAVHVDVEAADTASERERGLMGRTSLGAKDGMVFLFDEPTDGAFWMKDTLIPLSIAFWDDAGTIVGIRDMDPCTTDPCPTYGSPTPYVGALEVNQGFFEDHGVKVDDTIELS